MLIAEAHVATERSSRYLVQLCEHVDKVGRAHPQMQHVEWSDDRGVISLDGGRCTLRALQGVLALHVEAPDEDTLRRVEHRIIDRIERIGRRDHLTVSWTPPRTKGDETARTPDRRDRTPADPHTAVTREDPAKHSRRGGHAHD
jgi:hypothetical protein